jgi:signal transduction histidine kinase
MNSWGIQSLSVGVRGSRHQFAIALALVSALPLLALHYLLTNTAELGMPAQMGILGLIVVLILSGYLLLAKYPTAIWKLRTYLTRMVRGEVPDKVTLVQGEDDVMAIESSMNIIVERLNERVSDMRDELHRIEWILTKSVDSESVAQIRRQRRSHVVSLAHPLMPGNPFDAVDPEQLEDIVGDSLDLIEHSGAVFDRDGGCTLFILASAWCKLLCGAARHPPAQETPGAAAAPRRNVCECHLSAAARQASETGEPADMLSFCGIRAYAVPVVAGTQIIGAISFGYGSPPDEPAALRALAEACGVPADELDRAAGQYESRPPFIVAMAKNRLLTSSRLLGEIMERKRTEQILSKSEEELRRHRDSLEELVRARTAELESANCSLQHEISERVRAEKLKDDFVSTVSHELRTPLSIANEGVNLLLDKIPGDINARQEHVLTLTKSNMVRLTNIINDLLDISKIEAGGLAMNMGPVKLERLIGEVAASFEQKARQKGLEIRTRCDGSLEAIGDANRLMQVFVNLVGNALKFTERGYVEISAERQGDELVCRVRDTGVGIPADCHAQLFAKFRQFHRTEGAGERGTGLGLAIAKSLVELHHGRIWAESEAGKGSVFTFTLPVWTEETALHERLRQASTVARKEQRAVLVVLVRIRTSIPSVTPDDMAGLRCAFLEKLKSSHVIREGDEGRPRRADEIVVIAAVKDSDVSGFLARIERNLNKLAPSVSPTLPVTFELATCLYPDEANAVDAVFARLDHALATTTLNEGTLP